MLIHVVSVRQHNKHSSFNLARSVSSSSTLQGQKSLHFFVPVFKKHQNLFSAGKKSLNLKVEDGHLKSRKLCSTKLTICLISIVYIYIYIYIYIYCISKRNSLKITAGSAV